MKICIATGTRAEYGLLRPLMELIKFHDSWRLQILVTGAHLSPEFGLTYKEIEKDGFDIDYKAEMLLSSDTMCGIVKSMGVGLIGFADALKILSPDLIVILGDRYEMLSLATAALIFRIPIIHIHGGEKTEGAYDDAIRHSITKMSSLHFASTEEYKNRIIQLGENPKCVFNVGAIGLDNIIRTKLYSRAELEKLLDIKFAKYNYQITFHPETLADIPTGEQFDILLEAIDNQVDSFFIFTKANADTDGRVINAKIDDYVSKNKHKAAAFTSLGGLKFLSVVNTCDAIVGNSSSGIIEAPSLHTATINIGDRQKGRIKANSIIDSPINYEKIINAFKETRTLRFKEKVKNVISPYGTGGTAMKIFKILNQIDLVEFRTKTFYDIK